MFKPKIKKNDIVVVIAGAHKGSVGKVLKINACDERPTVAIEGVNVRNRRRKIGESVESIQVPVPIAYSNVAKALDSNK